jgi:cysteine-rich repeat protein
LSYTHIYANISGQQTVTVELENIHNTALTGSCTANLYIASCGDGYKDADEQCDDGNSELNDACDTFGTASNTHGACTQTYCGDGSTQTLGNGLASDGVSLESCDPKDPNRDDVTCNPILCKPTYCGDGLVQGPGGTWTSQGIVAAGDTVSPGA